MPYKYPSLRTTLPLAGYYARLDTGAAASDQFTADGTQNGTLTNGATRANDDGLAYSFDGANDYITANAPTLGVSRTIACWVKSSSLTAIQTLLSIGNSSSENNFFLIRLRGDVSGDPCEAVWENSVGTSTAVATGSTYSTSTWLHIAATVSSGNGLRLWVNGSLTATTAITGSQTGINISAIGALRRSSVIHFTSGLIDDAIIYNYEMASPEIAYLASQRGAIYQLIAGGSPINGQSLIRPAGSAQQQLLIQGATT